MVGIVYVHNGAKVSIFMAWKSAQTCLLINHLW
jgi:hypothetical protein